MTRTFVALMACALAARAPSARAAAQEFRCDGQADDTASLQAALDRGGEVGLPSGKVCRFSSLTASRAVDVNLSGSTLKLLDGPRKGPFIRVTGSQVTLRNGVIDGNREGGAQGWLVDWYGGRGFVQDVILQSGDSTGLSVTSAEASVQAVRTTARDFRGNTGVGFRVGQGLLVTHRCTAEANQYAGYYVSGKAQGGSVIDGMAMGNGIGALIEGVRGGRVGHFTSVNDDNFGLLLSRGASGWTFELVEALFTGRASQNRSATGVELFERNKGNLFNTVIVKGVPGYGLAIAGGSDDNRFRSVLLDASQAWDGDPGLVFAGGSDRNRLDSVTIIDHTVGVRFGERDTAADTSNNDNWIGALSVTGARHNAIRFEWGNGNRIESATIGDSDSSASGGRGFHGLVYFGNDSSNNRIAELVQADATTRPNYLVYVGGCSAATCLRQATATGNRVERLVGRSWSTAAFRDTVGGNVAKLVRAR